jgi:hemolysin activation/secretion protein
MFGRVRDKILKARNNSGRARSLWLGAVATGALAAGTAAAQTTSTAATDVSRFERPQAALLIPEAADLGCDIAPLDPERLPPGPLKVDAVRVVGDQAIAAEVLQSEWAPLIGRTTDQTTIDRAAARVQCRYKEAGFVFARVGLYPDGSPGRWGLLIREGKLAEVRANGPDDRANAFAERAFGHIARGRPLTLADLIHGQMIAQSYGVWSVQSQVRYVDDAQDALVLTLTVAPIPPSLYGSVQNASAKSVGTWSGGASLIFNGATPLYEHTSIGVFHDLTGARQRGAQISSDALLTGGGLGARGEVAVFQQRPHEEPPFLDTDGLTAIGRFEMRQPVAFGRTGMLTARGGLEIVNQNTDLATGPATVRDRQRVIWGGLQWDQRQGPTSLTAQASVRQGVDILGASRRGDPLLSRPQARPQATVFRFEAVGTRTFGDSSLALRLRAQAAGKPLVQWEEFSFGGLVGGRALDPGALYGDSGVSLAADFIGPRLKLAPQVYVSPTAFLEGARVWNNDTFGEQDGRALVGGAGIRVGVGRATIDLTYARPIGAVVGAPPSFSGPRILVTVQGGAFLGQ